nr:transcription factor SPT20 homolog [Drosophila kikkawai]
MYIQLNATTAAVIILQAIRAVSYTSRQGIEPSLSYGYVAGGSRQTQQASPQQFTSQQQLQQFPPLGSRYRKQNLQSQRRENNRQPQQPMLDTIPRPEQHPGTQQQQQPQQQNLSQQLRNIQNNQQWQRQEEMFMRSDEKMSVLVTQLEKMFQMMMSMMTLVTSLLSQNAPGSTQPSSGRLPVYPIQP